MLHVDVTKYGAIRMVAAGAMSAGSGGTATVRPPGPQQTYEPQINTAFVHTVIDDHSRVPTPRSATARKP
jgi:hypothetical protein